ncbi:MAG: TatD family hydrolase [Candidatus Peregrinibacteria bacterium]
MADFLIDTHAHIQVMPKAIQAEVIERAKKAGVKKMVNVACNLKEIPEGLRLVEKYDNVWTTAGIQPTDLTENREKSLEQVFEYAKNGKKVVAIGEIGLDYYWDKFPCETQKEFLRGQLEIADDLSLPAILHCRGGKKPGENEQTYLDMIGILEEMDFKNAVVHCFSGNAVEAEKLLDMGLMLSFTGIITYPQNTALRDVVRKTPLNRIMIETDSPFLPPEGYRGQKNEPAFVAEVAKTIAEIKDVPLEEVARMTSENAERFFRI